jgi:hypothetical protein
MFWRKFICLRIVSCICLSVLLEFAVGVYLLRRAYYFFASSAFFICTWRARISSALSILSSSSIGSSYVVAAFGRAVSLLTC